MNDYREKLIEGTNVIIEYAHEAVDKTSKVGDIVPHNRAVTAMYFYDRLNDGYYKRVSLSRDMIIALYDEITKIESAKELLPMAEILPF